MKITNVTMPEISYSYLSDQQIEAIKKNILDGYCEKFDNTIVLIMNYDFDIFLALKELDEKTQKITKGNSYLYEYELNIKDKYGYKANFIFDIPELSISYYCKLKLIYHENNGNNSISLTFDII